MTHSEQPRLITCQEREYWDVNIFNAATMQERIRNLRQSPHWECLRDENRATMVHLLVRQVPSLLGVPDGGEIFQEELTSKTHQLLSELDDQGHDIWYYAISSPMGHFGFYKDSHLPTPLRQKWAGLVVIAFLASAVGWSSGGLSEASRINN